MADDQKKPDEPKAPTLAELRAACPGADNDFIVGQLENNATANQAGLAWTRELSNRLDAARKEVDAVKKAAAATDKAKPPIPGAEGIPGGTGDRAPVGPREAKDSLETITRNLMKERGWNRGRAWGKAIKDNPELREALNQRIG